MEIAEAQRDVRQVYAGGSYGQVVSAVVWLAAAVVATVSSPTAAMLTLLLGGMLIFPATSLALRLRGGPTALPVGHPMNALAIQIAFTVPLGLLVAAAAAGYRMSWFFPAAMVIVGAHYLPFTFLYGMGLFAVLAGMLSFGGIALALWVDGPFSLGAWITGVLLLVFVVLLRRSAASIDRLDAGVPGRR